MGSSVDFYAAFCAASFLKWYPGMAGLLRDSKHEGIDAEMGRVAPQ